MKKNITILAAVVAIGLVAWLVFSLVFSRNQNNGSAIQSQTQSGISAPVQNISNPQNPEIAKDFLSDIQNANQIALGGTIIANPYALQIWGDANKGGEALLAHASSTGMWTLVSLGGGEWNAFGLIQEGVPVQLAQQLVAGLSPSPSSSPAVPAITIPAGNMITLGTAHGSVTMNNFYTNAAYIDQNQQAVVIQQSSTYNLIYYIPNNTFALTIFGTPLKIAQSEVEVGFLNALGISRIDACKLNVRVGVRYDIDPNDAGRNLGLSFCASGVFGK